MSDGIKMRTSAVYSQPDVSSQAYRMHHHAIARLQADGTLSNGALRKAASMPPGMMRLGAGEAPALPPPRKQKPWKKDPRCDPTARFFPSPNLDHLMMAEEL